MNVIFRLDKSSATHKLITLVYRFNGEKFVYSTGAKIQPEYWDNENKENPILISDTFEKKINTQNKITKNVLDRHKTKLLEIIGDGKNTGTKLTKDYFKSEMDRRLKFIEPTNTMTKNESADTIKDFYQLIDVFLKDSISGKRMTNGIKISKGRIRHYNSIINILKDFREKINVDDINLEFYNEFIAFRNKEKKVKKGDKIIIIPGKSLNTIGSNINIIKAVLAYTYKMKLHNNTIFEDDDFKKIDEDIDNVYLNDAELDILWNLKGLSDKLSIVRDVFIIGCYTGLRISDLSSLSKSNISADGKILTVPTQKTKEIVDIPLHPRVLKIIEKYGGDFPQAYSDQKMNDYIKELCQFAGFNSISIYVKTIGGKTITFEQPKWERITNHTARRSFASNMYLAGFDTLSIMQITGHQSEKTFLKYICVTRRQKVDKMLQHPYFKNAS